MASLTPLRARFGRRVRELRRRQKLSLETLGERAKMNAKYIQAVETGKQSPTLDTVEKLAAGLRVDVRDLLTFDGDESATATQGRIARLVARVEADDLHRIARMLEVLVDF